MKKIELTRYYLAKLLEINGISLTTAIGFLIKKDDNTFKLKPTFHNKLYSKAITYLINFICDDVSDFCCVGFENGIIEIVISDFDGLITSLDAEINKIINNG